MTHIRNRYDIQNDIDEEKYTAKKRLPNFFLSNDELSHWKGFSLSILVHLLLAALAFSLQVYVFSKLPKPMPPTRDIEFKLVQAEEKPPINKNTKFRSDRNTQAGGKHDPKRAISEPGTQSKQKPKPAQKAPSKTITNKVQNLVKPQKQVKQQPAAVKQQTAQAPAAKKPTPVSAPSAAKPAFKPTTSKSAAPSAPKIASAPKSPFAIPTPKSNAPVGSTYRPQGTSTGTSGGSSSGSGTPSPKFSSSTGSSKGSSGGSSGGTKGGTGSGTRGSGGGVGSGNNPGPGNPNGAPGIDSIRQPNWGPYMRDLEQRIKRNWFPPKGDSSKRVVIIFHIAKDGRLLKHEVKKSSGVPLADQAAMKAIESTAPFRPLPPEFKGSYVPIEFTFDYNVLNSVIR